MTTARHREVPLGNGGAHVMPNLIGSPHLVPMDTVEPETLEWLWPGVIPMGKVSMLAGDPGLGKSLVTLDMTARLSRGNRWPNCDEENPPRTVILLSAEDDPGDTIRPRLDAAGADVSKVVLLKSVQWYDSERKQRTERMFRLEQDIHALEQAVKQYPDTALITVDPVSAYCGNTDSHKNAEVRALLAPLADFAARTHVAVVCIDHLNKGDRPAMYRVMGSLGFVALARAVWGVIKAPNQPSHRLLLPIKCNLSPDNSGLSYRVIDQDGVPCLAWGKEAVSVSIDEVMAAERATKGGRGAELKEAAQWLSAQLTDGPVAEQELEQRAKEAGLKWPTVKRAKRELRIKSRKRGFGPGAPWYWEIPASPQHKEAGIPDSEEDVPYDPNGPYGTPIDDIQDIEEQSPNMPIEAKEGIEAQMNAQGETGSLCNDADLDSVNQMLAESAEGDGNG